MKANKQQLLYLFIFGLLFNACNKPFPRKNEITKIEIATGDCFGPCQPTIISIDSSLIYKFWAADTASIFPKYKRKYNFQGYYLGKISRDYWDTLNIKLERIKYKQLHSIYEQSVDDQGLDVFIHYGNKIKRIKAQSASLPDSVRNAFYYIIDSYKKINPTPTKDTLRFESSLYHGPPMPNVHNVKFPPPK